MSTVRNVKYYLYRHIRLDKNIPFYIGIGTIWNRNKNSNCDSKKYARAFTKINRSEFWKNVTSKSDYEVEILIESDDANFIKDKEREFIKLYGRKDLGLGTLVNLTDGGEGIDNLSEISREKIRQRFLGKKLSEEHKIKCGNARRGTKLEDWHKKRISETQLARNNRSDNNSQSKKVYQYNLQGNFVREWNCTKDIERELNIPNQRISEVCSGKVLTYHGCVWSYKYLGGKVLIMKKGRRKELCLL